MARLDVISRILCILFKELFVYVKRSVRALFTGTVVSMINKIACSFLYRWKIGFKRCRCSIVSELAKKPKISNSLRVIQCLNVSYNRGVTIMLNCCFGREKLFLFVCCIRLRLKLASLKWPRHKCCIIILGIIAELAKKTNKSEAISQNAGCIEIDVRALVV